jgi:hypothetical protein
MKNLIFAGIASASRKSSYHGYGSAKRPTRLPRYAPDTRNMFGFRCDLLLDYLVPGTLRRELDDPVSEPIPVIDRISATSSLFQAAMAISVRRSTGPAAYQSVKRFSHHREWLCIGSLLIGGHGSSADMLFGNTVRLRHNPSN